MVAFAYTMWKLRDLLRQKQVEKREIYTHTHDHLKKIVKAHYNVKKALISRDFWEI